MNIAKRYRQLMLSEFDTTLGELDPVWREAFQRIQEAEPIERVSTACVSGKHKVHVPATPVATVHTRGLRRQFDSNQSMLMEPGNIQLLSGLMIVPTVVSSNSLVFTVQVINFS